jgi:hypothetical protein
MVKIIRAMLVNICHVGISPTPMRMITVRGAVNGKRVRNCEIPLFGNCIMVVMKKNGTTANRVNTVESCWLSRAVPPIEPAPAIIIAKSRYPSIKYIRLIIKNSVDIESELSIPPIEEDAMSARNLAEISHITICRSPAAPSPSTLPVMSSIGDTDERSISITRFSFSSPNPCNKKPEEVKMDMTSNMLKIYGTIKEVSPPCCSATCPSGVNVILLR